MRAHALVPNNEFVIAGGDGEDYCLKLYGYYEGRYGDYINRWKQLLDNMTEWHFNTIRLAFSFADCSTNPDSERHTHTVLNYTVMNTVIAYLYSRGYKVVLDLHNFSDMYQYCGSPNWTANWLDVARHYKDDDRIIGYELFNEPGKETWYPTITTKADLAWAFANLTDEIRQIEPSRTIIWAGPSYFQSTSKTSLPEGAYRENVIFDTHGWMGNTDYANDYAHTISDAIYRINRTMWWQQQYPTSRQWVGEFGMYGSLSGVQFNYTCQRDYDLTWINACVANGWGFAFWLWSNQHWGASNYGDVLINSSVRVFDIFDALTLAYAYNSKPGDSNWKPNADINSDDVVDTYDAIILASHLSQHYTTYSH